MRVRRLFRPVFLAVLLAVVLLVVLGIGGCARNIEAVRVLADIAAGPGPSVLKQETPAPRRARIAYRVDTRDYRADLYDPGGDEKAVAALVLIPGAAPAGPDDPRLVAFATTLARARFTVLVPDMPGLRAQRVTQGDIRHIADAIAHLAGRDGQPGPGPRPRSGPRPQIRPLGVAAISYAVGPALIAALDSRPPAGVDFLVGIGGYHDLGEAIAFFTTGSYREKAGAPWRYREPNAYGKWIFVLSNTHRLEDAHDRATLKQMARRKLDDRAAPIDDLIGALGPEGRAVHALITNKDADRVPALIAALPDGVRREIAALDLGRLDLSGLRTRLILVHGRDDAIIPYTESRRLAAAAPPGRARLYLVDNLMHAELTAPGLWDAIALWRAVRQLLRERDGVAG